MERGPAADRRGGVLTEISTCRPDLGHQALSRSLAIIPKIRVSVHSPFDHQSLRRCASCRIPMRQEAHLRKDWWSKGEWTDTLIFGMIASDRLRA